MSNEAALARVRNALQSGVGHLHLDAPSTRPLANPWGGYEDSSEIFMGLKRALDPEGRFVEGRWPVNR